VRSKILRQQRGNHGRPPKVKTPKQEIISVLLGAEQTGFNNVAEALRRALAGLPDDKAGK
jgi:hypothetical protein